MIGKPMQDAMNEQINKELFSSYLYLSMAAYFEDKNLPGFGNWMRQQADEEREHAMKFYDFILERGGRVQLKAIDAPKTEWNTNLEVAEEVAAHEAKVTASIYALYELALKEKDYPAQVMLQWFISEQVEEEKNAAEIVANLKLIEERGTAVLMLDHRLSKRSGEEEDLQLAVNDLIVVPPNRAKILLNVLLSAFGYTARGASYSFTAGRAGTAGGGLGGVLLP